MLYLSGAIRPDLVHPNVGWMVTPDMGNRLPDHGWFAIDNACFEDPHGFRWERYQRYINRLLAEAGDRCLFVTTPDVPFDQEGTIERFEEYRERMQAFGLPVAMVTQDGMGEEDVPWWGVDAVFVGGSTQWKTGQESSAIVHAAKRHGKWVHMGRVNSLRRLRAAASMGCDSADGTFLKYGPDVNTPRLLHWLESLTRQPVMVL